MMTVRKAIALILVLLFLTSAQIVQSDTDMEELRYSSQIENDDKFTFTIEVLTDDGEDVESAGEHFGLIKSDDTVEITAIVDPSSKNLVDEDPTVIFDIFKIVVGGDQISKVENLGIVEYFIMPVNLEFADGDSKNYINHVFNNLNSTINTEGDFFNIETTGITIEFADESLEIDSWNSVYNRRTGVLQEMSMKATSEDGDDLDLQLSINTGLFRNLDINPLMFFWTMLLIPIARRKLKH